MRIEPEYVPVVLMGTEAVMLPGVKVVQLTSGMPAAFAALLQSMANWSGDPVVPVYGTTTLPAPEQMVEIGELSVIVGVGDIASVVEAVAVHAPFVRPTEYDVVAAGVTVMEELVAPVLHVYPPAKGAVSVALDPVQIADGPEMVVPGRASMCRLNPLTASTYRRLFVPTHGSPNTAFVALIEKVCCPIAAACTTPIEVAA